jgi:hypothetical protein
MGMGEPPNPNGLDTWACGAKPPCPQLVVLHERVANYDRERLKDIEHLSDKLEKIDKRFDEQNIMIIAQSEKIDKALEERNMVMGALWFVTRAIAAVAVTIPGVAWLWDHGFIGKSFNPHQ